MDLVEMGEALGGDGGAILTIGSHGIDQIERLRGFPRRRLSDDEVFVMVKGTELRCQQEDLELVLMAVRAVLRPHRREKDLPQWRVRATDAIEEGLTEAIAQIKETRAAAPPLDPPDSLLGRVIEAVTGTHELLEEERERSEDRQLDAAVEDKLARRERERLLRAALRDLHRASFFLTIGEDREIIGAAKKKTSGRDIAARFDGVNTFGCGAADVQKLQRALRASFGRATKLTATDNDAFDGSDDGKRLNEKAIEWSAFTRKLDTIRRGQIQIKVLLDGSNKGKIGYVQRAQRGEQNYAYYKYFLINFSLDEGYHFSVRAPDKPRELEKALRKTFGAKADQLFVR